MLVELALPMTTPGDPGDLLIVDAEVAGRPVDVTSHRGVIAAIEPAGSTIRRDKSAATVLDAAGGALIPGLHDHHVHLVAAAAAAGSLDAGPPAVATRAQLADVLTAADRDQPSGRWLRAVGYHESVAGELDRDGLDRMIPDRPVRVQHRSGAAWFVNSAALRQLGIDDGATGHDLAGVERDRSGRATGRLFGLDHWLRGASPRRCPTSHRSATSWPPQAWSVARTPRHGHRLPITGGSRRLWRRSPSGCGR